MDKNQKNKAGFGVGNSGYPRRGEIRVFRDSPTGGPIASDPEKTTEKPEGSAKDEANRGHVEKDELPGFAPEGEFATHNTKKRISKH